VQPETPAAHDISPWRVVYAKSTSIGLAGAFSAMAIVAASYVLPHYHSAATADASPFASLPTPTEVKPTLAMPPDADHKLMPDDLFVSLVNWSASANPANTNDGPPAFRYRIAANLTLNLS
jgi:hypothetical protein